jgi:DNA-directed RNA polymerase specialized sigma24 family protein
VTRTDKKSPAPGFEESYRDHRVALLRLAYLMSGSHQVSEDVVQTVFASAHDRWDRIDDPLPYLKRAVVNLVKDGQRRHFRRARSVALLDVPQGVLPPEVDETWELIQRLPWPQRAVVVLHYYEDLPLVEVSAVLGRAPSTVRSDHRRALEKLRKALS